MEDQGFLVETSGQSIEAIIIGSGALPRELKRNLENRHLNSVLIATQQELDPTLEPEFVFWFPESRADALSEFLTNFLVSLKPKLVIVGYDDSDSVGVVLAAVEKDLDARGVVVCDLYGPQVSESRLSLLWSKIADRELVLPDEDHYTVTPIFIEDAAHAVCLAAFSSQTYGQVVTVTGTQEMTVLNVAYRIRDHLIQTTGAMPAFHHEGGVWLEHPSRHERLAARDDAYQLLSWRPSTDLSEGLRRLIGMPVTRAGSPPVVHEKPPTADGVTSPEQQSGKKKINPEPEGSRPQGFTLLSPGEQPPTLSAPSPIPTIAQHAEGSQQRVRWHSGPKRFLLGIISVMMTVGVVWTGVWASARVIERLAPSVFDRLSTAAQERSLGVAQAQYQQLLRLSELYGRVQSMRALFSFLDGQEAQSDEGVETLSLFVARGAVELQRARTLDALVAFAGMVSGDADLHSSMSMSVLEAQLSALLTSLGSLSQFPDEWTRYALVRQEVSLARELIPIVKWVLGFDEKRTLLLVVQNASELRPTGGFLTGIGFLTFEKGRLLDVTLADISSIDAQLTGAEQPPEPIRRLMGENEWRARDANWNPDGPQAAGHIERVVTRATGRSVDGTVFLTSQGIRRILRETGPVLSPQGDEFSAENIVERATFDAAASLTSGEMTDPLLDAVRGLRGSFTKDSAARFARGMLDAASHQELFLTAHQPDIAQALSLVGFDGAITASTCPLQFYNARCTSDFLSVFDANLGVNRADYFLQRERDVRVTLAPESPPTVTVTLVYRNTATSGTRPAGTYHAYTRIMVPLDAVITSLTEEKDGRSVEVIADHDVQYGKRVEGFYLHVPIGRDTTIRMSYTRGATFKLDNGVGGYNLLLQKQPGVDLAPTSVTIDHGALIGPIGISPEAMSQDHSLLFDLALDRTTNVAVEFASVL